jgi:hypothetical protein
MIQAKLCLPFIAENTVQIQASPFEFCAAQIGT